jgi:ferric-dicitrate binding protein FerR (iron transport regulator)
MSRKDKNKDSRLIDILRYRNNEMTDRERNAFERSLQKDRFTEEALQGYEEINPEKAEADIMELKERLARRTAGRTKVIWYRIAASVAVLMILSSIFIIIEKNKPQEQLSYAPATEPSREIAKPGIADKPPESQAEQPEIVGGKKDADRLLKQGKKYNRA